MTNPIAAVPVARVRGTRDPEEFQLPLSGLYADLELGTASMHPPPEVLAQPALVRLRLLDGWQRDLNRLRDAALQDLTDELARSRPHASAADRLARLRSACASMHIELPADFRPGSSPG
ncbi:MAG: hypothetical protein LC125_11130 [Burkholderiales bacterium]|nr:hypothetical protein [Burkholderiales bacterium]